jgi:hypothetical protein
VKFSDVPKGERYPQTARPSAAPVTHTSTYGNGAGSNSDYAIPLTEVTTGMYQEPIALMIYGGPGSGKSRLAGTAPNKIGVLPMERKSRQSILRAAEEFGRKVVMPEVDLIRTSRASLVSVMPEACVSPEDFRNMRPEDAVKKAEAEMQKKAEKMPLDSETPVCCQRCYYRYFANRSKSVALRMAKMDDIQTIAIDTFGQLVDDILFANYGRNERIMPLDRKCFNREVCDFLNEISVKNLVLSHHTNTVWKDNKPTKQTKPASSFSRIGHYATVMAKMVRDDDRSQQQIDAGEPLYKLVIEDCQANAGLIGMELLFDENITFANLGSLVYPGSDWE